MDPALPFRLQTCEVCGHVQYPERELCGECLADSLALLPAHDSGRLLSWTLIHASIDPVFRQAEPWRVGAVALDAGPTLIAHLTDDVDPASPRVQITCIDGPDGKAVWLAYPAGGDPPKVFAAAPRR